MKIAIAYIYCVCENYESQATRFIDTFREFPPGHEHTLFVVVNGDGTLSHPGKKRFEGLTKDLRIFHHDDNGWDIGGYIALAQSPDIAGFDAILCCGGHCHFRRAGWLARFAEAWIGPGLYGSLTSGQIRPHICTTGFMVAPQLLVRYPHPVVTRDQRYDFEHGVNSFHRYVAQWGFPVLLVTWDGAWTISDWRMPPNIFRRGDQSNCLTFSQHSDIYDKASYSYKNELQQITR